MTQNDIIINTFFEYLIIIFFVIGLSCTVFAMIYKPPYNEKYYKIGKISGLLFMICIFLKIFIELF